MIVVLGAFPQNVTMGGPVRPSARKEIFSFGQRSEMSVLT
jgi:hypothetical protein